MVAELYFADVLYDGERVKRNALVEVDEDKIVSVEEGATPKGERVPFITPAFIDAHSHIGLDRHGESIDESDTNDKGESIWTYTDVLDGIQMDDKAFDFSVKAGVLYSCVLPGSGNILGGRAAVIRNFAEHTNKALIKYAGYKAALGYNPKTTDDWKGHRPTTRQGIIRELRVKLMKAQLDKKALEKGKKEPEELDVDDLFFMDLLEGKELLRVHVHRQDDIMALIRLVDAFNLKVIVEHAGNVYREDVFAELKKRDIPVIYGPLDSFAYKDELRYESPENIKALVNSGVRFGLMTDHPVIMQHNLLLSARWFFRVGFKDWDVINLVSSKNAEILGLHSLGKVKPGYNASFVLWNGSPFDIRSAVVGVVKEGTLENMST